MCVFGILRRVVSAGECASHTLSQVPARDAGVGAGVLADSGSVHTSGAGVAGATAEGRRTPCTGGRTVPWTNTRWRAAGGVIGVVVWRALLGRVGRVGSTADRAKTIDAMGGRGEDRGYTQTEPALRRPSPKTRRLPCPPVLRARAPTPVARHCMMSLQPRVTGTRSRKRWTPHPHRTTWPQPLRL